MGLTVCAEKVGEGLQEEGQWAESGEEDVCCAFCLFSRTSRTLVLLNFRTVLADLVLTKCSQVVTFFLLFFC